MNNNPDDGWKFPTERIIGDPNVTLHVNMTGWTTDFEGAVRNGLTGGGKATELEMSWIARAVANGQRSWDSVNFYITTARGFATILLGAEKRAFLVGIYAPGLEWAAGSTVDLDAALAAVASWHGGANIERFVADYPFMVPGELAVAYERGTIAEVQWGNLLSSEYPSSCLSLLAQLHGYEVLRKFFPEISYGEIRFTMPPPQRETSVIFVRDDSPGYSLREVGAESREYRASELDEVVNHIVEHLSLD